MNEMNKVNILAYLMQRRIMRFVVILLAGFIAMPNSESFASSNEDPSSKSPIIVSSIMPLHLIAKELLTDIDAELILLNDDLTSPHDLRLKPSHHKNLEKANIVFYIDADNYERFLIKPLHNNQSNKNQTWVKLSEQPGIKLLNYRPTDSWAIDEKKNKGHDHEGHNHDEHKHDEHKHEEHKHEEHGHEGHDHGVNTVDSHIWLGGHNGEILIKSIAKTLVDVLPEKSKQINAKMDAMINQWKMTGGEISAKLANNKTPYLVFHDAYQYFEKDYNIKPKGSIVVETDQPISAKRIKGLRETIEKEGIQCVLYEPQFSKKIIEPLTEGLSTNDGQEGKTSITVQEVDPLGHNAQTFYQVRQNLAEGLAKCLL